MAKKPSNNELVPLLLAADVFMDKIAYSSEWDTFLMTENGYLWYPVSRDDVGTLIMRVLQTAHGDVDFNESRIKDLAALFRRMVRIQWKTPKERYLAFADCLFDLETFERVPFPTQPLADGKIALLSYAFPFPDPAPPTPVFDAFLASSLVDEETHAPDPSLAVVAQEMMGNLLLPSLAGAAAFFFYGAGRNGKSVLADLCREMVGDDLSVSMTLEGLTSNRFATASLVGKKLNVCNEDESKYLKSDKFKAVVSGEFISAERKFEGTFNFRPQAKHVFCTNSQPRFDELNYGLKRRVKILPFYRRIPNADKDVSLASKLLDEMPGIVAYAIEGARRLKANNYEFSDEQSAAVQREMREFEDTISAASRFIRENYRLDDEGFVANSALYDHYVEWCKQNGNKPMNSNNFHKDVTRNTGAKSFLKKLGGEVIRGKRLTDVKTGGYNEDTLL